MKEFFKSLSVVIPFTSEDLLWKDLLQDLIPLNQDAEIILVGPDAPDMDILSRATEKLITPVKYVYSPKGVGVQLNTGARVADGNYFWFLHADTKVPRPAIFALRNEFERLPDAVHYFRLQYLDDGPRWIGINSIGANLRSHYLGLPLGNQGYAVSRATFVKIGGFVEEGTVGEDQCFIWEAKRKRIPINCVPASIFTSARKFEDFGWTVTTSKEILNTTTQATKECLKLIKQRMVEPT